MTSFVNALPGAVTQGLIWGIMAIGLYLTYQVLELSDLTVDGSFCTGGAVCVMVMLSGGNVWVAMAAAILAGILTQLGLWSVNLAIMDMSATQRLDVNQHSLLVSLRFLKEVTKGEKPFYMYPVLVVCVATALVIGILYWFFGTEKGSAIRATGANANMARAQGINTNVSKLLGLVISNGLVALSGALLCQYQGFAEINMGRGAIVIGLAAIIIGEVLFGRLFRNFGLKLMAVSLGSILYYLVVQFVISVLNINTNYLKLFSALIVAVFLAVPYWQKNLRPRKASKEVPNAGN